jgi:hypothetical protein
MPRKHAEGKYGGGGQPDQYFKSRDLARPGELPAILIRLMLAVNDIAMAAEVDHPLIQIIKDRL